MCLFIQNNEKLKLYTIMKVTMGEKIKSAGVSGSLSKMPFKLNYKTVSVIVLPILFILFFGFLLIHKSPKVKTVKSSVSNQTAICTQSPAQICDLLKQSAKLLDPSKSSELSKVVDKIKTVKGFDTNASLLFVLVTYYINIYDNDNAHLYLAKLNLVYKSTDSYDQSISLVAKSPEYLKNSIDIIDQQAAEVKANSYMATEPK